MYLEAFRFKEGVLQMMDEAFDLHNDYHFTGFDYKVDERHLRLQWNGPRRIVIGFEKVSHLSIEPRNPDTPFTEDDCLCFVAYASPTSPVDALPGWDESTSDMHLIFCFMSEMRLRVCAEYAYARFNAE
jgi:hypothetical protein